MARYWYLTGKPGSGKTQTLTKLLELLETAPMPVGVQGLLSPAVFNKGQKIAIDLMDISLGERKRLAELKGNRTAGPTTKRWAFHQQTLDWGNTRLVNMPGTTIFVFDELGPLELQQAKGLQQAIVRLEKADFELALVVVRPSLLSEVANRWPADRVINLEEHSSTGTAAWDLANIIQSIRTGDNHERQ